MFCDSKRNRNLESPFCARTDLYGSRDVPVHETHNFHSSAGGWREFAVACKTRDKLEALSRHYAKASFKLHWRNAARIASWNWAVYLHRSRTWPHHINCVLCRSLVYSLFSLRAELSIFFATVCKVNCSERSCQPKRYFNHAGSQLHQQCLGLSVFINFSLRFSVSLQIWRFCKFHKFRLAHKCKKRI